MKLKFAGCVSDAVIVGNLRIYSEVWQIMWVVISFLSMLCYPSTPVCRILQNISCQNRIKERVVALSDVHVIKMMCGCLPKTRRTLSKTLKYAFAKHNTKYLQLCHFSHPLKYISSLQIRNKSKYYEL